MTTHAYIHTVGCTLNSRLLLGHLGFVAGTLRGFLFPICCGLVGVQLMWPRALCQGALTSQCVQKSLNTTFLQVTGIMQQSSRFFLIRVFKRVFLSDELTRNKTMWTVTSKNTSRGEQTFYALYYSLKTRQPMTNFYLLTFSGFPLRTQE